MIDVHAEHVNNLMISHKVILLHDPFWGEVFVLILYKLVRNWKHSEDQRYYSMAMWINWPT